MIDLHCHSNFSDGFLTPVALLDKAHAANISLLALTDHDTVEGVRCLMLHKNKYPIHLISGIELSTRWKKYDIHVLGLNIDIDNNAMTTLIAAQNEHRLKRALEISKKMEAEGIYNAFEKACHIAGHQRVARPHFAEVFVNEGKTPDIKTAFKRFLISGKPAYVPTPWVSMAEAISTICEAGGVPVLAHPLKYKLTATKLKNLISDFKLAGGLALEVVSGEMRNSEIDTMLTFCLHFDLMASTGSDYHADGHSRISLGRQRQLPLNCRPVWQQWNL